MIKRKSHLHELDAEVLGLDVEDQGFEDGARIVDHLNQKTVVEGRDVQHVEECRLRGAHLVTLLQDVHVVDDFNCTLQTIKYIVNYFSPITKC